MAGARRGLEATHYSINPMNSGLDSPQAHIEAIGRIKEALAGI